MQRHQRREQALVVFLKNPPVNEPVEFADGEISAFARTD